MKILGLEKYTLFIALLVLINLTFACKEKSDFQKSQENQSYGKSQDQHWGRGLYAMPLETGKTVYSGEGKFNSDKRKVYLGWRLLATDADTTSFNIFRKNSSGEVTKLNDVPISNCTNFIDADVPPCDQFSYFLTTTNGKTGGKGAQEASCTVNLTDPIKPYKSIKLDGEYTFERVAMADLDGDGNQDFVVKYPGGNVDPWYLYWKPSPGTYKLEAYKSTGEKLWNYDLGWAIEQGTWYSPYLVYDFNGDGKAEIVVKSGESDPRNDEGKVVSGPEYLSILDGLTGKEIAKADWIPRDPFFEANKEHAYNYASRNQLAVAYLDGIHPHILVLRGTYNLMMVRAYRLEGNNLKLVWDWDNRNLRDKSNNYWGQGGHWTLAADVDDDGFDEVILGSCALDHNGTSLWTTGLGHPDAGYIGDLLPDRPGLEIYYNLESSQSKGNGMCMVDARTGKIIWGTAFPTSHVHGSGFCSDIDRVHPGRECYGVEIYRYEGKRENFAVMHSSNGDIIDRDFTTTMSVFWDTDNQRELLDGGKIFDYRGKTALDIDIEGKVMAIADIFGDWREEIITSVPGEIRIYSSTILSDVRYSCLLQDPIYRNYVARASTGYYQIPMTTYDLPFK